MDFMGASLKSLFPRLLLVAVVATFVVCGFHGMKAARSRRTDGSGPLCSTDAYLLQALGVHGAGEQILTAIAGLPPNGPLAIVAPKGNVFGPILLPVISSITWPHDVYLVQAGSPDTANAFATFRKDHFAAAFYYEVPPPAAPARHQIGPLTVVPISK